MNKVLIAGASGLVGFAAVRHFATLDDWQVVAISRRIPSGVDRASFISVDLQDRERCREVFGQMSDVTHLVYAALYEKPSLIQGWSDRDQMEILTMLRNLFEPLSTAAGLKHISLLQGTKAYGVHLGPMRIPARERNQRHQHENFYWLQEDYLRSKQAGNSWSWTILRPQLVVGEAIGGNLNIIPANRGICRPPKGSRTTALIPGGAPFIFEAVDAGLLARSFEWAATMPGCANEIFNITNGDVFIWEEVWPAIADAFGMEVGPPEPLCLRVEMPKKAAEWAAIVHKYGLRSPTDINAFVGESFEFTDFCFAYGADQPLRPAIVSTIKARQAGFHDCMDTEDMFRKWFRHFQDERLLPPR